MRLTDFVTILDVEIEVRFVPSAVGPWRANLGKTFYEVYYKKTESSSVQGTCTGWGPSPLEAISNLIANLNKNEERTVSVTCGDKRFYAKLPQFEGL